jgi:hypothetical protein
MRNAKCEIMRFKIGDKVLIKGDTEKNQWTIVGYQQYMKNRDFILKSGTFETLMQPAIMLEKVEIKAIGFKKEKQ